jgi:hypothetical protein
MISKTSKKSRRGHSALIESLEGRRMFALLGLGLDYPLTTLLNANPGALNYTASTGKVNASATPIAFLLNAVSAPVPVYQPASSNLEFFISNTGTVTGGVAGDDFTVTGDIDVEDDGIIDYSGVLLTGEVSAFGFEDSGNTDFYDVRMTPTGGALFAPFFTGKDIGMIVVSENSTFTGDFSVDFRGQVKANIAPIAKVGPRFGSISGTKFLDVTGNSLSNDDTPLGGTTIQLYNDVDGDGNLTAADGAPIATDVSEPGTGAFSFSDLSPGKYLVKEVVGSGYVRTFPTLKDFYGVEIGAGQAVDNINFANAQKDCCRDLLDSFSFLINNNTPTNDLRGNTNAGDTVTVIFTVKAGTQPIQLSLVSYSAPSQSFNAGNANQQRVFDVQTGFFGPGTHTMTVLNPSSFYQVDFVCGAVIDVLGPAGSNVFYTPQCRLLSADNDGPSAPVAGTTALSGFVWADTNDDGIFDDEEDGIPNATVTLTGLTDGGVSVSRIATTDVFGKYNFANLLPGVYNVSETQPGGFEDGKDSLGTNGGTAANDLFSGIRVDVGNAGTQYNFGEIGIHVVGPDPLGEGMTATIGYWRNKNGQRLICQLNGSSSSKLLGNWLATTFPKLYGSSSMYSTANRTNSQIADLYKTVFNQRKFEAQAFAVALAIYATDTDLAGGNFAAPYGFITSNAGTANKVINVGTAGSLLGFANHSLQTVFDILKAVDVRANSNGTIGGSNSVRSSINALLTNINETGDIV